ncbi:hypothetical protein WAI453_004303 [Rhynchosporium graminicola]
MPLLRSRRSASLFVVTRPLASEKSSVRSIRNVLLLSYEVGSRIALIGTLQQTLEGHNSLVGSVAFSPDSRPISRTIN